MQERQDPWAIVVPCSAPNAYGAIRSLASRGVRVLALDHGPSPLRKSRLCLFRVAPDPDGDLAGFIDYLVRISEEFAASPVLFPTQDLHALAIQQHREELEERVRFPFMPVDLFLRCIDKRLMMREAEAAGISVPETHVPATGPELYRLLPRLTRYPYVVKPVAKFELERGGPARNMAFYAAYGTKALRADSPGELERIHADVCSRGFTTLVQELIAGPTDALSAIDFYVDRRGRLAAYHTGRKMRQFPADFGTCTLGRSEPVPEIVPLCRRFVERVGFVGIGNMEFKERDGVPVLMEINPRPWMWIQLATRVGVNLPYLAYRDLTERPWTAAPASGKRAGWIDLRVDLLHLAGRLEPGRREAVTLGGWLSSLGRVRVEARSTLADPGPAFDALTCGIARRFRRVHRLVTHVGKRLENPAAANSSGVVGTPRP